MSRENDSGSFAPGPYRPKRFTISLSPVARKRLAERSRNAEIQFRSAHPGDLQPLACNPAAVHTMLYKDLSPTARQAIGTLRGTSGTDLEQARRAVLTRGAAPGLRKSDPCAEPAQVAQGMNALLEDMKGFWDSGNAGDAIAALADLSHRFFWIHPFLDGNGHVWRLILIALARSAGLEASPGWRVAVRPYGASFSLALQQYPNQPGLLQSELANYFKRSGH